MPLANARPPCSGATSTGCGYAVAYDGESTHVAIDCGAGTVTRTYSGDVTEIACNDFAEQ